MRADSIRKYLRPQKISSRRSTFNNAFASALATHDEFDPKAIEVALSDLGQDPAADLVCVYCGEPAATWDHLHARVKGGEHSGYGHRIRNLVPACRTCNERKGGRTWEAWLDERSPKDKNVRSDRLRIYVENGGGGRIGLDEIERLASSELQRFNEIRHQVFELLAEADELAAAIRKKVAEGSALR
jgi:5-methylcytosine-specific restriction endonuclease McrA